MTDPRRLLNNSGVAALLAVIALASAVPAEAAVVTVPETYLGVSIYQRNSSGAGAASNNNQVKMVSSTGASVSTYYPAASYPATTERSWNYSLAMDVHPDPDPNYAGSGVTYVKYLYVADTANHRIRRFALEKKSSTPTYNLVGAPTPSQYLIEWGSYGSTLGNNAATTRLAYPGGIAVHPVTHDVYVADTMNSRILVFEFTTDPNMATPRQVSLEGAVFSGGTYTIQQINPSGSHVMGSLVDVRNPVYPDPNALGSQATITDDGGAGVGVAELSQGRFYYPHGLALDVDPGADPNDPDDDVTYLYVADTWNHRVQVFIDTTPGYASLDYRFHRMWGGYSRTAAGRFRYPRDVAVSRTGAGAVRVFVADTRNRRIQFFDKDALDNYSYQGSFGGTTTLVNPVDLAVDRLGNVYVADPQNDQITSNRNSRIRKYDNSGAFVANIGATALTSNALVPYGIAVAEAVRY